MEPKERCHPRVQKCLPFLHPASHYSALGGVTTEPKNWGPQSPSAPRQAGELTMNTHPIQGDGFSSLLTRSLALITSPP